MEARSEFSYVFTFSHVSGLRIDIALKDLFFSCVVEFLKIKG